MSDADSDYLAESFSSAYLLLSLLGVDPSRIRPNHQIDDEDEDSLVSLALPDSQIAILTDEDDDDIIPLLREEGWKVFRLDSSDVVRLHGIMSQFNDIVRSDTLVRMSDTTKTTSTHETILLEELLRRNLPRPDRNFRFLKDNGKELTTPDFTWERHRIAFFMDGLWWHVSMEDKERLEVLRAEENENDLMEMNRGRQQKDRENRSILSSRGWIVLSCTDADLETPEGVRKVGKIVEDAIKNAEKGMKAAASVSDLKVDVSRKSEPIAKKKKAPSNPLGAVNNLEDMF